MGVTNGIIAGMLIEFVGVVTIDDVAPHLGVVFVGVVTIDDVVGTFDEHSGVVLLKKGSVWLGV